MRMIRWMSNVTLKDRKPCNSSKPYRDLKSQILCALHVVIEKLRCTKCNLFTCDITTIGCSKPVKLTLDIDNYSEKWSKYNISENCNHIQIKPFLESLF